MFFVDGTLCCTFACHEKYCYMKKSKKTGVGQNSQLLKSIRPEKNYINILPASIYVYIFFNHLYVCLNVLGTYFALLLPILQAECIHGTNYGSQRLYGVAVHHWLVLLHIISRKAIFMDNPTHTHKRKVFEKIGKC